MTLFATITNTIRRALINIAERLGDPNETFLRNNDALSASIRVACPAQVVSWDPEKNTIVAQPTIREKTIYRKTGQIVWETLPLLVDVPVQFPGGSSFINTFPLNQGDEVLIIFSDTCIDAWWSSGGIQNTTDRRRHDLSDAIAIPVIKSLPNAIQNINTQAAELRTLDGNMKISLNRDPIDGDSMTATLGGGLLGLDTATISMGKQSVLFNSIPTPFNQIQASVGPSSITFLKTVKVISGVPTLLDTIDIEAPRLIQNGVG